MNVELTVPEEAASDYDFTYFVTFVTAPGAMVGPGGGLTTVYVMLCVAGVEAESVTLILYVPG
jgi:hypothetical protein